jgi:hypothetical protein
MHITGNFSNFSILQNEDYEALHRGFSCGLNKLKEIYLPTANPNNANVSENLS